jgi:hypothetical protein
MGLELFVAGSDGDIAVLLERLAACGMVCSVLMVDQQLHPPGAKVAATWQDVRLKTPGGTVALKRRNQGVAVVVFGNADEMLQSAQQQIARALTS